MIVNIQRYDFSSLMVTRFYRVPVAHLKLGRGPVRVRFLGYEYNRRIAIGTETVESAQIDGIRMGINLPISMILISFHSFIATSQSR